MGILAIKDTGAMSVTKNTSGVFNATPIFSRINDGNYIELKGVSITFNASREIGSSSSIDSDVNPRLRLGSKNVVPITINCTYSTKQHLQNNGSTTTTFNELTHSSIHLTRLTTTKGIKLLYYKPVNANEVLPSLTTLDYNSENSIDYYGSILRLMSYFYADGQVANMLKTSDITTGVTKYPYCLPIIITGINAGETIQFNNSISFNGYLVLRD